MYHVVKLSKIFFKNGAKFSNSETPFVDLHYFFNMPYVSLPLLKFRGVGVANLKKYLTSLIAQKFFPNLVSMATIITNGWIIS